MWHCCINVALVADTGLGPTTMRDIMTGKDISEEHLVAASKLLRKQFPDLQGLAVPLNLQRKEIYGLLSCDVYDEDVGPSYLQMLNTGTHHWNLLLVHQGKYNGE